MLLLNKALNNLPHNSTVSLFEYLSKLILYKAASIDLNVDYKGILANVKVDASLASSLVLTLKLK